MINKGKGLGEKIRVVERELWNFDLMTSEAVGILSNNGSCSWRHTREL